MRALAFFGGVTKAIVCDNLKAGVAKALWFEPTLNATFAAMAEHCRYRINTPQMCRLNLPQFAP